MKEWIWKSSQAIIIDREANIYLESNKKIGRLSLIWWKVEFEKDWASRETYFENAMIRELKEETWIDKEASDFKDSWEYQEAQEIPKVWLWESMYYVIILETTEEIKQILENWDINKYTFQDLEVMQGNTFAMPKEKFLKQIQRGLNLL